MTVFTFLRMPQITLLQMNPGQPVLNENGEEEFVFYDGFLDRSQLPTQVQGN
jgi:hypothetical protein